MRFGPVSYAEPSSDEEDASEGEGVGGKYNGKDKARRQGGGSSGGGSSRRRGKAANESGGGLAGRVVMAGPPSDVSQPAYGRG